ncbi:MAG TPA: hypothetical protein VGN56_02040 [Candidatus Paceibacterota bacterium]|jgi:hypothetical protein|nr:hypothetical protein [Candidatus Paceibacterota bacterium]
MTILTTILAKLAAALTALAMTIGLIHAPANTTPAPVPLGSSTDSTAGLIPSDLGKSSSVSSSGQFTDTNWSLAFTLRKEWNVNEILDAARTLHQMQISGSQQVIFISKDEAIGLSSDLAYTTATRTIAGKSVEVRTYSKPSASYAYYQTFTLNESDGTYHFLLKSATPDTTITDTFIRSIVQK